MPIDAAFTLVVQEDYPEIYHLPQSKRKPDGVQWLQKKHVDTIEELPNEKVRIT